MADTASFHRTLQRPQPVSDAVDLQVRQAVAEMVFDRSRSSNLLGVPMALLICALLWNSHAQATLLAWLAAKCAVTGWRVALTRRFDAERPHRVLHWHRHFTVALVADGFVFGLMGTWLLPEGNPVLEAVLVATLLGIASIALVVLSMSSQAALALTVPVLLPGMVMQLLQADPVSLYLAAGMGVFLCLVVVEGRRATAHTEAMLRLQFGADELAAERQQALVEAERSNAVKGRFLATMSHEMRTPLHGILGLAQLLRAEPDAPAPVRSERLQTLQSTGEHLLGLINDVLDYSRIEGGHLRLREEPLDLRALVESATALSRVAAADKGLALRLELDLPAPCWVWADPARLRQVLLNLLGNAVKFTTAGSVTLRARLTQPGHALLEVLDTGPGVPPADRERVFQAFEQLDGSFARRYGGTGLGLAISRELVQAMGGELSCHEAPGGGACFAFAWPVRPAQAPVVAPVPSSTPQALRRARVLLAEDNPVNALVAQAVLERLGLEVTAVPDGAAAVDAVLSQPGLHDVVLMDCQMPGIDGFEATARIRAWEAAQHRPRLPIVALTANALEGDRERSLAAGMDDHLAKPFQPADLQRLLLRWLGATG
jgi:two-component system, sensor histidine kinase